MNFLKKSLWLGTREFNDKKLQNFQNVFSNFWVFPSKNEEVKILEITWDIIRVIFD